MVKELIKYIYIYIYNIVLNRVYTHNQFIINSYTQVRLEWDWVDCGLNPDQLSWILTTSAQACQLIG
jgi:hypothetical protein